MAGCLEYILENDKNLGTDHAQRLACLMLCKQHLSNVEQEFVQNLIQIGKLQQPKNNYNSQVSLKHLQEFILSKTIEKMLHQYGTPIIQPLTESSIEAHKITQYSNGPAIG
jgi:hypothetical protein